MDSPVAAEMPPPARPPSLWPGSEGCSGTGSQADTDHPADGSGRMRRRVARHGARLSRRLDSARGAARRLRRLARRQQGQQHRARPRARYGLAAKGFSKEPVDAARIADALHHPLELQPFRGAGRDRRRRRLSQRSRRPAAGGPTWRSSTRPSPASSWRSSRPRSSRVAAASRSGLRLSAARAALVEARRGAADPGQRRAGRARRSSPPASPRSSSTTS